MLYKVLLRLYPRDFRILFANEMLATLDRSSWLRESLGLITGAAKEWVAKRTSNPSVRGRALPDWRVMRPTGVTREVWFK
jgi:hypothetical protein